MTCTSQDFPMYISESHGYTLLIKGSQLINSQNYNTQYNKVQLDMHLLDGSRRRIKKSKSKSAMYFCSY